MAEVLLRLVRFLAQPDDDLDGRAEQSDRSSAGSVHLVALAVVSVLVMLAVWTFLERSYPFFADLYSPVTMGRGPVPPTSEQIARSARLAYANSTALVMLAGGSLALALVACRQLGGRNRGKRGGCYTKPAEWDGRFSPGTRGGIGPTHWPKSFRASGPIVAAALAFVLGGLGGDAGAACGQWLSDLPTLYGWDDSSRLFVIQAACWGLTGLGVGLAMAGGDRDLAWRAAGAGCSGGVLSGLVYPIASGLVGIFFPAGETRSLVPDAGTDRLVWLVSAGLCIGASLLASNNRYPSRKREPHPTGTSTRSVLMACCLATIAIGWALQFRALAADAGTVSGNAHEECLALNAGAVTQEMTKEQVAHVAELGKTDEQILPGDDFPLAKISVEGWLRGLPADGRGKVVVVDIWDPLCIGCRQGVPCLVHAYETFHGQDVLFVGLTSADKETAERFLADSRITWPNGFGAGATLDAFGTRVPTVCVIGRDGRVAWTDHQSRYVHYLAHLDRGLSDAIRAALDSPP